MVWFQCEDCGENLKKPKLPNHFRICSATKLSCIDCGVMFGQDSVQSHTQCITEAEKYGPKGQGKATNGAIPKPGKDSKQQPDIDINVGLSQRSPWFCSLCKTSATSKQTLLGHADGKKHRAKARAFHASRQQTEQTEESPPDTNALINSMEKEGLPDNRHPGEERVQDLPKIGNGHAISDNGKVQSKKRKLGESANDLDKRNAEEGTESLPKKANHTVLTNDTTVESGHMKEDYKRKIKWKKLIKSALKSNPEGALKMKKLKKLVLELLKESGVTEDENELRKILEQKINSSSRFRVDEKFVRLVAKD